MKFPVFLLLMFVFSLVAAAQTSPPDSDPKMLGSANYELPQSAIDAEIDGDARMAVHVDDTGKPTKAELVGGPMWPCGTMPVTALDDLNKTLLKLILGLRFSPAMKAGIPVEKDIRIMIHLESPKLKPRPAEIDSTTGKPKPRLVSAGIMNGKATSLPKQKYPNEAQRIHAGGEVTIRVLVDEAGKVIRAGAVDGHPTLQLAARDAACHTKFAPLKLSGNPIKVSGVLKYNFVP